MAWDRMVKIILILLVLFALLFLFFNPYSGYGPRNLAKITNLANQYFNLAEGASGEHADEVQDSFNALYGSFLKLKESSKEGCFEKMNVPSSFGNFNFTLASDGKNLQLKLMRDKSAIPVSRATLEDVTLCSVSGGDHTENFYNRWLASPTSNTGADVEPLFNAVINDDGLFIETKERGFEIQYLYKPTKDIICLIPSTSWALRCKAKRNGLTEECADEFPALPKC